MKIKKIEDEKIIFNNGYILEYYHSQDCCEEVYADFEVLKTYNVSIKTGKEINIKDIEFNENLKDLVQLIEKQGFNLISNIGEKFFVPCYNYQNGYYSDDLELYLKKGEETEMINITECNQDNIY